MYIKTATGSIYEVDRNEKRIRRLQGTSSPTPRQGEDGEWKTFVTATMVGEGLLIVWDDDGQGTLTSPIVKSSDKLDELVTVN